MGLLVGLGLRRHVREFIAPFGVLQAVFCISLDAARSGLFVRCWVWIGGWVSGLGVFLVVGLRCGFALAHVGGGRAAFGTNRSLPAAFDWPAEGRPLDFGRLRVRH